MLLCVAVEPVPEPSLEGLTFVGEGDECNGSLGPEFGTFCEIGLQCVVPPDAGFGASGVCSYGAFGDECGGNVRVYCADGLTCVFADPDALGGNGMCLFTYTIDAKPITVYQKGASLVVSNIETDLLNSTLNFGTTTTGDLWVSNSGSISLYEPGDEPFTVTEIETYESPLQCPSGFVVQEDDTLIFLSEAALCARKAGMNVNNGPFDVTVVPVSNAAATPGNGIIIVHFMHYYYFASMHAFFIS